MKKTVNFKSSIILAMIVILTSICRVHAADGRDDCNFKCRAKEKIISFAKKAGYSVLAVGSVYALYRSYIMNKVRGDYEQPYNGVDFGDGDVSEYLRNAGYANDVRPNRQGNRYYPFGRGRVDDVLSTVIGGGDFSVASGGIGSLVEGALSAANMFENRSTSRSIYRSDQSYGGSLIESVLPFGNEIARAEYDEMLQQESFKRKPDFSTMIDAIEQGANPNLIVNKNNGQTLLMWAVEKGNIEFVDLLLSKGADPNAIDLNDRTVLYYAVYGGVPEIVRALLECGADPNQGNDVIRNASEVPLAIAINYKQYEVVEMFLQAGADPNIKMVLDKTPLMIAASASHGRESIFSKLLAHEASFDAIDSCGDTVLIQAVKAGNEDIVRTILRVISDDKKVEYLNHFNYRLGDDGGKTALMYAALRGHGNIIRILLAAGVDPNLPDTYGKTALMLAVSHEKITSILELAAVQVGDEPNNLQTYLIEQNISTEDINQILFVYALVRGDIDAVRSSNADVMRLYGDHSSLMYAVRNGGWKFIRDFLDQMSDAEKIDLIKRGSLFSGETVLMSAAASGDVDIANILLNEFKDDEERKRYLDMKDKLNKTAIVYAAEAGKYNSIVFLLEKGAAIEGVAERAAANGYAPIVMLLLDNGFAIDLWAVIAASNGDVNVMLTVFNHEGITKDKKKELLDRLYRWNKIYYLKTIGKLVSRLAAEVGGQVPFTNYDDWLD